MPYESMRRKKQKGKRCSVVGCKDWCRCNDLCAKHNMAKIRYGSVYGAKDGHRKAICANEKCGKEYVQIKTDQKYCDPKCYKDSDYGRKKSYQANKRYRENNRDKDRARQIVSKRIRRGVSLDRGECLVCSNPDTEAHHHNYSKPDDVIFLCKAHHKEIHKWDSN